MIQTGPTMRILVATKPVDFRKGIGGLAATCRQQFEQDPMTGCAFVFRNRQGTAPRRDMAEFPPPPTRAASVS